MLVFCSHCSYQYKQPPLGELELVLAECYLTLVIRILFYKNIFSTINPFELKIFYRIGSWSPKLSKNLGRGGGRVDRAADWGPSLIPFGEKKESKWKRGRGWPILKNVK